MADPKNDQNASKQNKGSGSDTASAAKISAGTSVGNPGATPMPHAAGSPGQGSSMPGSSAQGSSGGSSGASMAGNSPQSSTLASHTSKPMGGQAGSTGQGGMGQGSQGATPSQQPGQGSPASMGGSSSGGGASTGMGGSQGQSGGGTSDQAKQAAEQVQEKASEALDQASEWARDTYERASSWASDAFEHGSDRPGRGRMGQSFGGAGRGVQQYVAQNPVMVGLVGLAAGLLIGALLPRTRREDEVFGEWADEVRQQGMRYAQDMTQRGREYVDQAFSGEDPRFSKHDSEFQGSRNQGANRH